MDLKKVVSGDMYLNLKKMRVFSLNYCYRYIVQDEINKNYKVEKGWHTTTYVPKDRR